MTIYRDLFTACAELMPHLRVTRLVPEFAAASGGEGPGVVSPAPMTIVRAIILIESLPAVWEMEEVLHDTLSAAYSGFQLGVRTTS